MTIVRVCSATIMAILLATTAWAQDIRAAPLAGLRTFGVAVEPLDADAIKCGITQDDLSTSIHFILGQSRMTLTDDLVNRPYVYLDVTVLSNCSASYQLSVIAPVTIQATNKPDYSATIWNEGGLRTGGNPQLDTTAAVEGVTKQLVNDWNSANK